MLRKAEISAGLMDFLARKQRLYFIKITSDLSWRFSRDVIAAMHAGGRKQKISHQLLLFVHQKSYISLLLVSLEVG